MYCVYNLLFMLVIVLSEFFYSLFMYRGWRAQILGSGTPCQRNFAVFLNVFILMFLCYIINFSAYGQTLFNLAFQVYFATF